MTGGIQWLQCWYSVQTYVHEAGVGEHHHNLAHLHLHELQLRDGVLLLVAGSAALRGLAAGLGIQQRAGVADQVDLRLVREADQRPPAKRSHSEIKSKGVYIMAPRGERLKGHLA